LGATNPVEHFIQCDRGLRLASAIGSTGAKKRPESRRKTAVPTTERRPSPRVVHSRGFSCPSFATAARFATYMGTANFFLYLSALQAASRICSSLQN
jgi:hypothetical protein